MCSMGPSTARGTGRSANDLALRSGVHDPLFNFYLPLIAKDRDEDHRLSEEGYAEEIM